jgi:hypothetical protein
MNRCPYCGAPEAVNAPGRFYCGSDNNRKRSKDCLRVEIGLLKKRVDRLEQAGDLLAEWHLSVVTTREKAERDVERWNEAKGQP